MKAWRLNEPGGPTALALEDLPRPEPTPDQVLIGVRAFGLNRSEWFTRIGDSPTVRLPRVLGIECVGTVVSSPGGQFTPGQRVCAMMGGMGREFDGSYAQYTCVPVPSVFAVETDLPWDIFGALPEMLQTCHGSLHTGLGVEPRDTLLIRGGTSSIGLSTLAMAKDAGLRVTSTSRTAAKTEVLREARATFRAKTCSATSPWWRRASWRFAGVRSGRSSNCRRHTGRWMRIAPMARWLLLSPEPEHRCPPASASASITTSSLYH